MTQATFSLTWDLHKNNICNGLSALQQKGEFVDMTLAADGHHVKVHQMVMVLASPYIKELLASATCPHPIIFLNKISYTTLKSILEYIYTGEVVVSGEHLSELIQAARELRIKGLEDMEFQDSTSKQTSREASVAGDLSTTDQMDEDICYFEVTDVKENSKKSNYTLLDDGSAEKLRGGSTGHGSGRDRSQHKNAPREKQIVQSGERRKGSAEYRSMEGYKGETQWFVRGEHYYVACRSRGASTSLRCAYAGCPVRWMLRAGRAGPLANSHDHEPTPWVPERNAMFQALKRRTATELTPLPTIYAQEANRHPEGAEHLPWESVVPSMRKWRKRNTSFKIESITCDEE